MKIAQAALTTMLLCSIGTQALALDTPDREKLETKLEADAFVKHVTWEISGDTDIAVVTMDGKAAMRAWIHETVMTVLNEAARKFDDQGSHEGNGRLMAVLTRSPDHNMLRAIDATATEIERALPKVPSDLRAIRFHLARKWAARGCFAMIWWDNRPAPDAVAIRIMVDDSMWATKICE